ncbi:hypothetical protein FIV04_25390 (plasmid) [Vibrio sp. THAF190c]|jgi:phage FluMu protein Com|nr:hypothetical protein FIV04_25390 [Vibrio sp. THAF190c]
MNCPACEAVINTLLVQNKANSNSPSFNCASCGVKLLAYIEFGAHYVSKFPTLAILDRSTVCTHKLTQPL